MIGSIWRKWDLHLHTPGTALNDQFSGANGDDAWETYLKTLEAVPDVAVLGITDYFSIDNYRKVQAAKTSGRLPNVELILPNVEIRILPVTQTETPINFHFIFSPEIVDDLDDLFFSKLQFPYDGNQYNCTRRGLISLGRAFRHDSNLAEAAAYEIGINQFKVTLPELLKVFSLSEKLRRNTVKGVSNSNNDGNSGIQHSSLAATRQEIYRFSDFIFSGNPNDRTYFLGLGVDNKEKIIQDYGGLKPCIHGSDAHENSKVCKPDKDRFTFIKADPTFDGLRQILYEPQYRVHIGDAVPVKPPIRIEKVAFNFPEDAKFENENFCFTGSNTLEFSPYFTCIIGGRGTGKSTVLNLIHEKLRPGENRFFRERPIVDGVGRPISISSSVKVDDDTDEKYIEFLSQNEVEEFAQDYQITSAIYQRILKLDKDGLIKSKEVDLIAKLKIIDELIADKRTIAWNQSELEKKQKALETDKKLVDSYTSSDYVALTEEIRTITLRLTTLEESKFEFDGIMRELDNVVYMAELEGENFKEATSNLYLEQAGKIVAEIKRLISESQAVDFSAVSEEESQLNVQLNSKKQALREYLTGKGLTEENLIDISNANLTIDALESDIVQVTTERDARIAKVNKFDLAEVERASRGYKDELEKHIKAISAILEEVDGTSVKPISLKLTFDSEAALESTFEEFKRIFEDQINKGQYNYKGDGKLSEILFCVAPGEISTQELYLESITNFYSQSQAKSFLLELFKDQTNFELYKLLCLKSVLNYSAFKKVKVQYDNRPIEKSSFGQRCTAVLVILLLLGNNPIIIDEPEAHLDSLLISNYLVEVIKEKKSNRQIIFATHNANFVVNGDAELIHIFEIDSVTRLTTKESTTIENETTRENLIGLEGGKEAFVRRESKYQVDKKTI